jgi:hypothetical protein
LPLVKLPRDIPEGKGLAIGFAVGLSHLYRYDRCTRCGRLSYIAASRFHRRKMVSCDTSPIERRAADLQEWIAEQMAKVEV